MPSNACRPASWQILRMCLAIMLPPFQATFSAHSKITTNVWPMFMVFAAAMLSVIPATGTVEVVARRRLVVADVFEQVLFQAVGHVDPCWFPDL